MVHPCSGTIFIKLTLLCNLQPSIAPVIGVPGSDKLIHCCCNHGSNVDAHGPSFSLHLGLCWLWLELHLPLTPVLHPTLISAKGNATKLVVVNPLDVNGFVKLVYHTRVLAKDEAIGTSIS